MLDFRILGPVEVHDERGPLALGPPRNRALLSALVIDRGVTVSVERLVDMLWGERAPATATTIVHGSVAALRKALEPDRRRGTTGTVLVSRPGGYALETDAANVDALRFERLVGEGSSALATDPARASELLGEALALWRGPALADVDAEFAAEVARRLDDRKVDALEARLDADLAAGRHHEVVAAAEDLSARHPLRESVWALAIVALYRCGRQGDALRAYESVRTHLRDELGADPSAELRRLHEAILRQDDAAVSAGRARALPTGVLTFLLTDVEGSTGIWERHPDGMRRAQAQLDRMVRECAARGAGVVPVEQGEGDSAVVVFARATDAVACALDLQRSLHGEPWPDGIEIALRIGLHTGEAELREGTYHGLAVNRCARLRSLGHGGQVLLSGTTAGLVRDALPGGASLVDLGSCRLKGLSQPEHVWQLAHPRLRREFPPLAGSEGLPGNLPVPLTSFLGRSDELHDVAATLERSRVVTLTGPGGTGKTRLAIEAARRLAPAAGTWFVDLASVSTEDAVVETVTKTVGIRAERGRGLLETLSSALGTQPVLLILDNCEHLLDASARVVHSIVSAGEASRILATSREAIGVAGEVVYPVAPLPVPADDAPWDRVAASEAVRLFAERASAARPGFAVSEDNAHVVAEICRRLDGVPLAVELAAARSATLPLRRIADRLDDRFRLLGGGPRTAAARHRSLAAAIEWSYDLLDETARELFERLSVFAGGFSVEAAEAVAKEEDVVEPADEDTAERLSGLVARSLVQMDQTPDGHARYRMLETLRTYGLERLDQRGATAAVRERHARYCGALADEAHPHLFGPGARPWIARLSAEHDNFRAALEWAFGPGGDAGVGVRLVCVLWFVWDLRGLGTEGSRWAAAALAHTGRDRPALRASVLQAAALFHLERGEFDEVLPLATEEAELGAAAGDSRYVCDGLAMQATVAWAQGRLDEARRLFEEAIGECRTDDAQWYRAMAQAQLTWVLRDGGDLDAAAEMAERALADARAVGEVQMLGLVLDASGSVALHRGDLDRAAALARDALAHYRSIGWTEGEASALNLSGRLAWTRGEADEAQDAFVSAFALCQHMGHRGGMAAALDGLARAAAQAGGHEAAAVLLGAAGALREAIGAALVGPEKVERDELHGRLAARLGAEALHDALWLGARTAPGEVVDRYGGPRLAPV